MTGETPAGLQETQHSRMSNDKIATVTGSTFTRLVLEGEGPIVVEFMSYGCAHCRVMEPVLQQVAGMVNATEKIFRVNNGRSGTCRQLRDSGYADSGYVSEWKRSSTGRRTAPDGIERFEHCDPGISVARGIHCCKFRSRRRPFFDSTTTGGVCRHIARWVHKSAKGNAGEPSILLQPIGDDPEALPLLNPDLDIWDAYATIHLLMPDGSMKLGGEAVAEVLRSLPNTRWFAWTFATRIFGVRPFQTILNVAYTILADVRPIFGCESCGTPSVWLRPIGWMTKLVKALFGKRNHPSPHFTSLAAAKRRQSPVAAERAIAVK
jgi:Thioredoxin